MCVTLNNNNLSVVSYLTLNSVALISNPAWLGVCCSLQNENNNVFFVHLVTHWALSPVVAGLNPSQDNV